TRIASRRRGDRSAVDLSGTNHGSAIEWMIADYFTMTIGTLTCMDIDDSEMTLCQLKALNNIFNDSSTMGRLIAPIKRPLGIDILSATERALESLPPVIPHKFLK